MKLAVNPSQPRFLSASLINGGLQRLALPELSKTRVRLVSSCAKPTDGLVDRGHSPADFAGSAVVYRDFLSLAEGELLTNYIKKRMKRRRYEKGHWDAVITDYKEIELLQVAEENVGGDGGEADVRSLVEETQEFLQSRHLSSSSSLAGSASFLPPHAIDLKANGGLHAHVDSVRFSGDMVAGISLLSPSIMRLKPANEHGEEDVDASQWVDLYLLPLSLYVLTGTSRYQYTHELLPSGATFDLNSNVSDDDYDEQEQDTIVVERGQRLSVIFRDAKPL